MTAQPEPGPPTPDDRLARANLLRREGRWREAEAAYVEIAERFGAAAEAEVARLSAAALRLEHLADPAGALVLYRSLLHSPTFGNEAYYGVARCERARGNTAAEQVALAALVERDPASLQATRARQRLEQLRGESTSGKDPKP